MLSFDALHAPVGVLCFVHRKYGQFNGGLMLDALMLQPSGSFPLGAAEDAENHTLALCPNVG